jgi:multidrug resistance protein MdtO
MTEFLQLIRKELAATPNRLSRSIMIALICGFVVLVSKTISLPGAAISAFLIVFVSKEEASVSIATAFKLIIVVIALIFLIAFLFMLTAGEPLLRIIVMFTIAFASMYLARATSAGVIVATLGMVLFELLSVLDYFPYPALVLSQLFWLIPIVVTPMAILMVANLLFGRSAIDILRAGLSTRLTLIKKTMLKRSSENLAACRTEFLAGGAHLKEMQSTALATGRLVKETALKATHLQDVTMRLLSRCVAGTPPENTPNNRLALSLADADTATPEDRLLQELVLATPPTIPPENQIDKEVVDPREAMRFAIKATIAIAICYAILTLTHWPAIRTITITAFLVSLGTTAETFHKATLRVIGCLIGAVISFFCLIFIIPYLSNASELAVLVVLVTLPAAWITVGSENTSYIGLQIALVFFLSVINTSGPTVDLGVTWGRIVGIILGNLVVAGVFLSLWPNNNVGAIKQALKRAVKILGDAYNNPGSGQGLLLGQACDALNEADRALTRIHKGFGLGIVTQQQASRLRQVHGELESIAASVMVSDKTILAHLTRLQKRLKMMPSPQYG